jgi:hypothetical protein
MGLGCLFWPAPDLDEAGIGAEIIYMVFTAYSYFLLALPPLFIAIYQYIPQICTVIALGEPGSISIPSLILQVVFFLTLGISQALRLGLQGDRPGTSYRLFNLYLHVGTAWVPYVIAAVGQVVLLGVFIYYTGHKDGN